MDKEKKAKIAGSTAGAVTATGIGIAASGASAATMTGTLAAVGGVVGGGMAAGIACVAAAPIAVGAAAYGAVKLIKKSKTKK